MKAINGKLAAVVVSVAIGIAGVFAPSTGRATEQVEDGRTIITANSPTFDAFFQDWMRIVVGGVPVPAQHLWFGSFDASQAGRHFTSEASQNFGRGLAAGESFMDDVSFWGSGSRTSSENDFAATAYESNTRSASFGGDVRIDDIATLGVFLSFSNTETTSSFNNGGSETDSISFGPYVSAVVNDNVYVDASFGFLSLETDNRRIPAGAVVPITGGQDGSGVFGAANLNYSRWMENINFNGRVGVTASNVQNDNYVDSTGVAIAGSGSSSAQLQLEAQASYFFDNFAPFVRVGYNVEASSDVNTAPGTVQPANDKDEFVVGGGVNLFGFGAVTGGINYSKTLARSQFDSWTVTGQISITLGGG